MEALQLSQLNIDLSPILSSCEPELQELMRQIDLIIKQQQRDWEKELQLVQLRLRRREEELVLSRNLIQQKDLEVRSLCKQLQEQKDVVSQYEKQLQSIREEFDKLKRGYQKLQHKQLKESRQGLRAEGSALSGPLKKSEENHSQWVEHSAAVSSPPGPAQDSSVGHHRDWDRSPLTGPSEGAVQRLFHQWHAMSSASEDTGRLSSSPSSSSSGWLRSSVPDSAADGQTCTLKESVFPAFEESCSVSPTDRTVCCFLEEEEERSTELLRRLDGHILHMKESNSKTQSKCPPNVPGPAHPHGRYLAQEW